LAFDALLWRQGLVGKKAHSRKNY